MNNFGIIVSALQLIIDIIKLLCDLNVYKILSSKIFHCLNISHKHYDNVKIKKITDDKRKSLIKRRLKAVFFLAKKNSDGLKHILGAKLIFSLKRYETEENCISNIYYWKSCGYIDFEGNKIETMTAIKILEEGELLESITACKS